MLSLSILTVVLRVYVRTRIVKAFGWDDFFMVCALVSYGRSIEIIDESEIDHRSFSILCSQVAHSVASIMALVDT